METSTTCNDYSAVKYTYFLTPIIALCVAIAGIVVLEAIRRRDKGHVPVANSVMQLFGTKSFLTLASSTRGGIVQTLPNGHIVVDAGVLLCKNFVRVSDHYAIRSCNVKYAMIYRYLPRLIQVVVSAAVGPTLALLVENDGITKQLEFIELKHLYLEHTSKIKTYYV
ncbi:TPA: hypothetical protein N0F65_010978 [Lagenidium giganteum]|uniref:Uncharacterized protein n=1 Tax=Lagenidium giganteum TaxID=4803 RepID=A0AAV2Z865_9STRA|nr:TPA: hypothetical protein N0F65_010978 [Lagenidium giganteum]